MLVLTPHRMPSQISQQLNIKELRAIWRRDHAHVPALLMREADKGRQLPARRAATGDDVKDGLKTASGHRAVRWPVFATKRGYAPIPGHACVLPCRRGRSAAVSQASQKG